MKRIGSYMEKLYVSGKEVDNEIQYAEEEFDNNVDDLGP